MAGLRSLSDPGEPTLTESATAQATKLEFLRHTLATLAYRGGKTIRGAPEEFARFRVGPTSRLPIQILAHLGDLLDWALSIARGQPAWHDTEPARWEEQVERFFAGLAALDRALAQGGEAIPAEKLFQGPIADALTHVGQLAMLRRLAGAPIRGENYLKARIAAGAVGAEQPPAVREFD